MGLTSGGYLFDVYNDFFVDWAMVFAYFRLPDGISIAMFILAVRCVCLYGVRIISVLGFCNYFKIFDLWRIRKDLLFPAYSQLKKKLFWISKCVIFPENLKYIIYKYNDRMNKRIIFS